ncbi:hypothetical protein GIB67_022349 [Kingdonia uniflora]|uniref:DUF4283 domain-containing protein n=1 Tax=Kingdonia uniflora TaxID=39325 RepID=A0A7J7N6N1_9MAGN|nr:hypothetical protein GIB67_022349 [Kingdonia uniflora]
MRLRCVLTTLLVTLWERECDLYVKETLKRLWELKGDFDMSIRKKFNLYFFKFHNEEDRAKVLELGSQHVASRPFVIREWRPFIEYEPIDLKTIPLWVIFKEIPEQFWNSDGLGLIASAVGKPMFLDKVTEENKKRAFARICVEVGADNILPKKVNVLVDEAYTIEIPAEYNWLLTKCEDCVLFGHNKTNCPVAANVPPAQETINPSTIKTRMKWIPKAPTALGKVTSDDKEGWEQPKKTFKASMSTSPSNITTHNAMQALDFNIEENNTLEVPNRSLGAQKEGRELMSTEGVDMANVENNFSNTIVDSVTNGIATPLSTKPGSNGKKVVVISFLRIRGGKLAGC